jgi:glycosyltransferase involved in cell wall biosynthesis
MKVLYVVTRADHGGAQIHLLDLLRGFRDRFDVAVATGEEGYLTEETRRLGIPVHILPRLVHPVRPIEDSGAVRDLHALIRETQPTLIHAHTSKAGLVGRLAARLAGVPAVYTAHTWGFMPGTPWMWKLWALPGEWLGARASRRIIVVSEYNRALALRYRVAPARKLVVVHNGVPDTPYRARPDEEGEVRLAMVARFTPQKDQMLLVRALAGIETPVRLLLIGDGPTRAAVEAEAHRLGLADRVEFLGSRDDVAEILAGVHIGVLASNWEAFGIVVAEAMRAGLPVVASRVGGVEEVMVDGVTGFLVPRGDVGSMQDRLHRLVKSPDLRMQMGEAGRRQYETRFTIDRMLERTSAVYAAAVPAAYHRGWYPAEQHA